ncbi:MAG: lysophospholipase, partial [Pseudomonadota bacterium]
MTHDEGHLESGLYYRHWPTGDTVQGTVLIAHGLAEHSARYDDVAAALNAAGYAVWAVDHVGHGRSPGPRCVVKRFSDFLDGIDALFEQAARSSSAPVTMLGHSMGGLIAAHSALRHPARYANLVLSGPAVVAPDTPPGIQVLILRAISALLPATGVLALDGSAVSRDATVVQQYFDDPLVYNGKVSARLATELFDAMAALRARAKELSLPMLLLHGTEDRLTAPSGSQLVYDTAISDDKTLKFYDGLYHEVFNEP